MSIQNFQFFVGCTRRGEVEYNGFEKLEELRGSWEEQTLSTNKWHTCMFLTMKYFFLLSRCEVDGMAGGN